MACVLQRDILAALNMTSTSTEPSSQPSPPQLCMDRRLYARELSKSERAKHDKFVSLYNGGGNGGNGNGGSDSNRRRRDLYLDSILETLTPDDVR